MGETMKFQSLRSLGFPGHPAFRAVPAAFLIVGFAACTKVPLTGRSQLDLVPDSEMLSMANQQYADFLKANKESTDPVKTAQVKRVGTRLQGAVEKYFRDHGLSNDLKNYQWEFHLIESKEMNAWCMPGGKVVVYTGILPVTQSDTGLAVVLGHEIAHAVAKHGSERMSQSLLTEMGGVALSTALSKEPAKTQSLFLGAYGVGTQVGVLLPYSRTQESEADHLGLIFMAMAGYNPDEAVAFWQRMVAQSQGGAPPEILSTHPSDKTRIDAIRGWLPEAHKYYTPA
jgi:predicted Zn-dependent protease